MRNDTIFLGVVASVFMGAVTSIGATELYRNAMFNSLALWLTFVLAIRWKDHLREEGFE